MDLSERKLSKREQIEGEKPKEGSLESNDLCQTRSNALEMSRATIKDSPKSLRAEDQIEVTYDNRSPVDLALRKPYW